MRWQTYVGELDWTRRRANFHARLVLPHAQLSSLGIFPLLRTRCSPKCTIQPLILAHISLLRMCLRDLSQCGPVLPKRPAAALTEVDIDKFTACLERGSQVSAVVY